MEAIEELTQLSESLHQASAILADEDVDDTSSSTRRPATFLDVVVLGNVVSSFTHSYLYLYMYG
jgi:dynamin GTPase